MKKIVKLIGGGGFLFAWLIISALAIQPTVSAQSQRLPTETLSIVTSKGQFEFNVEIADEAEERTIGLMNREKMDPRSGMLFVFGRSFVINMWMKNTLISLDMVFINNEGEVVSIARQTTPQSLKIVTSQLPASYVLELNAGMADFIGVKKGNKIIHRLFDVQN